MKRIFFLGFMISLLSFAPCSSSGDNEDPVNLVPSNLSMTVVKVGADNDNPNESTY